MNNKDLETKNNQTQENLKNKKTTILLISGIVATILTICGVILIYFILSQ